MRTTARCAHRQKRKITLFNERGKPSAQGKVRRAWLAQPARTQVGWLHELRVLRHVICVDGERLSWPMVVGVEKKAPKTHMDGRPAQAGKVARRNALTFLMQKLLKVAHTREKLVGSTLRCSRNDYQIVTTHQAPIFNYVCALE